MYNKQQKSSKLFSLFRFLFDKLFGQWVKWVQQPKKCFQTCLCKQFERVCSRLTLTHKVEMENKCQILFFFMTNNFIRRIVPVLAHEHKKTSRVLLETTKCFQTVVSQMRIELILLAQSYLKYWRIPNKFSFNFKWIKNVKNLLFALTGRG